MNSLSHYLTFEANAQFVSPTGTKYHVPREERDNFYRKVFSLAQQNIEFSLVEKVTPQFAFYLDIDKECTKEDLQELALKFPDAVFAIRFITKTTFKIHAHFPNTIVSKQEAKARAAALNITGVDASAYNTGLRMLGSSMPNKPGNPCYFWYQDGRGIVPFDQMTFEDYKQFCISFGENDKEMSLPEVSLPRRASPEVSLASTDDVTREEVIDTFLKSFEIPTIGCVSRSGNIKQVARHFYIPISYSVCPFVKRPHQRPTHPLYLDFSPIGCYLKCHDEDCKTRRFPKEEPLILEKEHCNLSTLFPIEAFSTTDPFYQVYYAICSGGSHAAIAKCTMYFEKGYAVDSPERPQWFKYNGNYWEVSSAMYTYLSDTLAPLFHQVGQVYKPENDTSDDRDDAIRGRDTFIYNTTKKIVANLESIGFRKQVIADLGYRLYEAQPHFMQQLDEKRHLIQFNNGTFDLISNILKPSNSQDYISFTTGYDYIQYDEHHPHTQAVYAFLDSLVPNPKVKEYLLLTLGRMLMGIPDEKFHMWVGYSGENGKSTLSYFILKTLKDYAQSMEISLLTNKRAASNAATPDMIKMKGKRFIVFQEPETRDKLFTGLLKQLTGDDELTARALFKDPVTFTPQASFFLCCNDPPSVSSSDGGTRRRMKLLLFESRFVDHPDPSQPNEYKKDPTLKSKMNDWKPYFMSILLHYHEKVRNLGYVIPEPHEIQQLSNTYNRENDIVLQFRDDCTILDNSSRVTLETLFEEYKHYYFKVFGTMELPRYMNKEFLRKHMSHKLPNQRNGQVYLIRFKKEHRAVPNTPEVIRVPVANHDSVTL